jgi:predicted dehydrogenase
MSTPIRVGMISWAHVHAEFRAKALLEEDDVVIAWIADDDEARGRAAAERFGVEEFSNDWRPLVERADVDVVFVHAENDRHVEPIVAAAQAGLDVFCEKPVATNAADAQRMADAVAVAGVDGTAAFVSRFSQEATRAKRIVESGALGDIVNARAVIGLAGIAEIGCPPDMVAWMEDAQLGGGGAWIDEGTHMVDLLRWLVGDVVEVGAMAASLVKRDLEVEDVAVAMLRFAGGALGEVSTNWSMAIDLGMRNAIELYGAKGTLFLSPTSRFPSVDLYTTELAPELRGWVSPHIVPDEVEPHDYNSWPPHVHHYKREIAAYVARRRAGVRPYGPTLDDGLACARVIDAGYRAAREGATVAVDVPVTAP